MSNSDLSSLIGASISWADFGSKLVIGGICLEIIDLIVKCAEKEKFCAWFGDRFEEMNLARLCKFAKFFQPWILLIEVVSFGLVVIGLTIEMQGSGEAYRLSARQNAALNKEAGEARKLAGDANVRAAITESNNLSLQTNVLSLSIELEQLKQPRTITIEQITNFIILTKNFPKVPIRVLINSRNSEVLSYAVQVRAMLNQANFNPPEDDAKDREGIHEYPNAFFYKTLTDTNTLADVIIILGGVNDADKFSPLMEVFRAIKIGKPMRYVFDAELAGADHLAIMVIERLH